MINFQECRCGYCKRHGNFPVLFDLKNGKYWFEIPKNGSNSIKSTFKGREHVKDFSGLKDVSPVVILRDPIDRFQSLFRHYFLEEGRRFKRGASFCSRNGCDIKNLGVQGRLDFLVENLHKLTSDDEVHHFYPQVNFIDQVYFDNFVIVDIKKLSNFIGVPKSNNTRGGRNANLTKHQSYIRNVYNDDYVFLKKHNVRLS